MVQAKAPEARRMLDGQSCRQRFDSNRKATILREVGHLLVTPASGARTPVPTETGTAGSIMTPKPCGKIRLCAASWTRRCGGSAATAC